MAVRITEEEEDGEKILIAHYDNKKYIFHKKGNQELEYWGSAEAVYDEEMDSESGYPSEVEQHLSSEGYTILN